MIDTLTKQDIIKVLLFFNTMQHILQITIKQNINCNNSFGQYCDILL